MSANSLPRYGTSDTNYGMQLATIDPDEDGPVWMVNVAIADTYTMIVRAEINGLAESITAP